jgi:hypothetical protein
MLRLVFSLRGFPLTMSASASRPPGASTRAASAKTRCLTAERLITPFEITGSNVSPSKGSSSMLASTKLTRANLTGVAQRRYLRELGGYEVDPDDTSRSADLYGPRQRRRFLIRTRRTSLRSALAALRRSLGPEAERYLVATREQAGFSDKIETDRWTTSSTDCGSPPGGAFSWRAQRASVPSIACSAPPLSIDGWTRSRSMGSRSALASSAASAS